MELNFSKKTRKIVASLLAVAILLGVLPVSGLTGNSSGAESSSSENSTKTIYVNSTKQPILFDSVGNFKEIIPKVKKNIYSTEAENGDKIALFTDIGNGNSVVFYKTTEWTPSAYMWKEDSSENPDKNAAWPGEAMKKYGDSNSSLYYYVYKSAKEFDKVIFNDGNDQNGDQTDNKDLKAWNVYTKTSAGRPICDSLTKCDVSDNFNVYEYADSKLSGKNISAPQGMGATIEIADKKYTVCGDGAKSEITCYEDDEITSLTANTVDGYTAKVTDSVVGDNQITYSVTYTNKTYGMQFSVENTVTFIKKPRLVLEGKWNVTFDGKPVNDGDTICKQEGIEKELKASFDIEKVTFKGTEITEGYETAITLNDNKFNSSCESSNLKDNNTLVVTVTYKTDKEDTSTSTFKFSYVEGNAVLEENDEDSSVYFEGKNIYTNTNKTNTNTNKDEITLKLTKSENVDDVTFSLRKGVSTPDSSNEIKDAVKREGDKVIIDNTKLKLSDIKKATLTLKSEKFGISDDYTLIYDTISKDNFTYSNTNENGRYFVNAHTGVTVTFNLVGIDEKLFNDENAEVTCGKENGVKISFDKDIKEWKATITKSDDYTFTFSNNGFVQTVEITDKDLYLDDTVPVVNSFKFEDGSSDGDKLLSFLTFGIYHNDKIKVTVTAEDPNEDDADNEIASSGVSSITLYNGENKLETKNVTENQAEFILSSKDGADTAKFNLYATATDNVGNESKYWTFDRVERISHENGREFNNLSSYDEPPTWDNFEVVATKENPEVIIKDEDITAIEGTHKYTDNDKMYFSSGANIKFKVTDEISGINSVKVYLDGDSESGKQLTVTTKSKNDPARYDQLKTKTTSDTFSCNTGDLSEGEHTIRIYAQNNSGNIVDGGCVTKTFYVDKTAPVITSFDIQNNDKQKIVDLTSEKQHYNYYFQTDTQVTVNADDNAEDKGNYSGIKTIYFRAYDVVTGEEYKSSKNVSTDNATASATFTVRANFKGELYAYAVDNVDNNGKTQHGEKKPDDLIVETQQHHNGNASVTMSRAKASYKDNSGLDLYSGNVNARVVFEDAYAGIKDAEIKVSDYTNTVTNTISVSVDNNGNITSSGNGSVTVTGTKAKNTNDNLITNIVVDYVVTDNSNNIKITTSMTDRAGNKTDNVKDSLSIDKTKPVIDVKYDNNEHTTYGGNDYYKADRTATVTVTERNFDESLVEAAIMRNSGRYTTIGGWTHNNNTADPDKSTHVAKIVYNTDGDFTFDIAVKDKAMNSADKFTQQKFTVDKTAPVIDVSFDNNSAKNGNYYKADRTATIKITEHNFNSGSQYVNIPVTAEGATAPSVVGWSGSGDDHNATVSFNKDGKYSFTVDYTDLAGNKAVQKKVDSFYIDKTAPEVEITGVADHQAYNGTVAPVVTYRDDNFTDDHDFKFTRIDINSKSDDTSKFDYDTDGNGVTEFIYKYRDFAEVLENDGIYNFTVELSDKAGNSTSKSVTFSVNRFGSTFKASDESEKLIKNGYTNAEQDIVVEEINVSPLTKHSVTLAKSGGNSTELVENTDYKFTSSNNGNEWCKSVYTVNKKNFSDEAAYTVTIMSVDKAKNTNNNRMADSSLSTEQKNKRECAISFVVDKTSPLVSITGIKDNELYKEASKKVKIVCEDDNLDKSKLVVTLDNKKLAEGEDYTIVDDKDGSIAGMLTAEIVLKAETGGIKENLKVTIGDLAGNTGEKSVDNFILSANIFQRFFANPVLVICTFAGLALVIAAVIFFVAKKRKKTE